MSPVDAIALLIPLTFFGLLVLEAILPQRMALPERRGWRFVGLGFLVMMGIIQGVGPTLVPASIETNVPRVRPASGPAHGP